MDESFIGERVFELVSVMPCFFTTDNRKDRGKFYFSYSLQIVFNLLLFVEQLFLIRQSLPLATAAYSEMLTKGFNSIGRIFFEPQRKTFSPIFLVLVQLHIDNITGNGVFDEDNLTIDTT